MLLKLNKVNLVQFFKTKVGRTILHEHGFRYKRKAQNTTLYYKTCSEGVYQVIILDFVSWYSCNIIVGFALAQLVGNWLEKPKECHISQYLTPSGLSKTIQHDWSIRKFYYNRECIEEFKDLLNTKVFPWLDQNSTLESFMNMLPVTLEHLRVKIEFETLRRKWEIETKDLSSPVAITKNENYQKIIQLGQPVIPLIIDKMKTRMPMYWDNALRTLVGESSPKIPLEETPWLDKVNAYWIQWAEEHLPKEEP